VREKYPSVKSIGFIMEDEPGARAIQAASKKVAKENGFEVLAVQLHPFEKTEYYPEWTKLIMQKPDAVDQGLKQPQNTANSQKQARELGYTGPIFAPIPGDPALILKMIGNKDFATDFIHASYNAYDTKNTPPLVQEIVKMWESSGHKDPYDGSTTQSWDAMWCLVQAIDKAQSIDPTDVKNAWENMQSFETTRGPARMGGAKTFGINHIVCGPAPIIRYMNGEIEFIKWHDSWMP
jgi:branched-chain amino acid transport system substrate-binding protein